MSTQCNTKPLEFEGHGRRRVVADFDGGPITSDAGALLLRRVEQRLSLLDQVADCFTDHRNPDRIQHSLRTLGAPHETEKIVRQEASERPLVANNGPIPQNILHCPVEACLNWTPPELAILLRVRFFPFRVVPPIISMR